MNMKKMAFLGALAVLASGCGPDKLAVRQEGRAVVIKAARAEMRVENGRITRLTGPDGMTANAGSTELSDRAGLGVMTSSWLMTLTHQPLVMPHLTCCRQPSPESARMWRRPGPKSVQEVAEIPGGVKITWKGLSDGKDFFAEDELSMEFGMDGDGAVTVKTRGRSPKGNVFCVQTPIEDIAGANSLVMPIMGGQRYNVGEMKKAVWSITSDCMRYEAPVVAIETAKGSFGMWTEDDTFRNFAAYFPKNDTTASFGFEFMNIMPYEPKTEAESPVLKIDAFPGTDWLGAAKPYREWFRKRFAKQIAVRDGFGWAEDVTVLINTSFDRFRLFNDHLDTLTNLFGKGVLFNFFKATKESTRTKKFDWELPGHTPDENILGPIRERQKRGIRCACYMNTHCVNYNSESFRRDGLDAFTLPTVTNPYGYKDLPKQAKGTPAEKWKALKLKDGQLVYVDNNSKKWRDYIIGVHRKARDFLGLDTIYEDCIGVIRDIGNGETDGTSGSLGVHKLALELQEKMPLPYMGEFGPAPVAMAVKFPLLSIEAYRNETEFLQYRIHHTVPMSVYLFGNRPWGTGSEGERSEDTRYRGCALSDAYCGLGFVSYPPWNMESGINDHMTLRSKVFADNMLKPYFPESCRMPEGVVSMYRGRCGGIFTYSDDGKVQVMRGPDGKPLYGRVDGATEFDIPGLELPGWPMREGSRHYGLKRENFYALFPVKPGAPDLSKIYGKISPAENLVLAYDTPEFTYLELAGKEPKITFKVKESKPGFTRVIQSTTGLELKADSMMLTDGRMESLVGGRKVYLVKPAGFRTVDFVHTVKPGEAFRVVTQNREWGTQLSNASRVDLFVNGVKQTGYDAAPAPNPHHERKFKRFLFDYRMHQFTVPLDKWVGQTVLLSVRVDFKGNVYDDRQRLAMPEIVRYSGEPLDMIVPGMVPPVAWERFNGGVPPHEGDDATFPGKAGKKEAGLKAVGELNNGLQ